MKPTDVYLCAKCAEGDGASTCVCCNEPHKSHKGVQCKQCASKGRFKCGRCGEGVKQSRVAALLCDTHGLGSRAKECCRMKVQDSFHQTDVR